MDGFSSVKNYECVGCEDQLVTAEKYQERSINKGEECVYNL